MRLLVNASAHVRTAVLVSAGVVMASAPTARAQICVYVYTYDDVTRVSGNAVQGSVEHWLSGACKDYYFPIVEGWVYKDDQPLQYSNGQHWGYPGGSVSYTFPSLTLSVNGPGTYTAWGLHSIYCRPHGVDTTTGNRHMGITGTDGTRGPFP